jgi:hypothetical protein
VVHHSGDLTKVDRFPSERWTTSTGIVDRFAPESVDHFDRNTHNATIEQAREFLEAVERLLPTTMLIFRN